MKEIERGTLGTLILVLVSVGLFSTGCGGYTSPGEKLQRAVFRYNNAVRWSNYPVASEYIPEDERAKYLAERRDSTDELRILEFKIDEVRHSNLANKAEVLVTFRWVRPSSNVVEKTTFAQHWDYGVDKTWLLKKRVRVERKAADRIDDRL